MPLAVDSPAPLSTTAPPSCKAALRMRNEGCILLASTLPAGAAYVTLPWCLVRRDGSAGGAPRGTGSRRYPACRVNALYRAIGCPMVGTPGFMSNIGGFVRKGRTAALAAGAIALAAAVVAAAATSAPAVSRPDSTTRASAPKISIKPGVLHLGKVFAGAPTTADCEKAFGVACYVPAQLQRAYNLSPLFKKGITGKGRTIAIVDSFGSPTIKNDLAFFDKPFGLPAPPSFKILAPAGQIPRWDPKNSDMVGWAGETTLDVEWAHAMAPGANIVLIETPVSETEGVTGFPQIVSAESKVISNPKSFGVNKPDVISQSFSASEETFTGRAQVEPLRASYKLAA